MLLKQMEIVTDKDKLSVDIQKVCNEYKTIKQWAYILHNQDDTRPHYHIYLNFGSQSIDTLLVARWFGFIDKDGKVFDNFINKVQGRKKDMLKYLTHANAPQKHQYLNTEVISNFDFVTEIKKYDTIGDFEHFSYAQQIAFVHSLPLDEREKEFKRLENLWKLECKYQVQNTSRNLTVIFITGESGSGKTTFAKELLKSKNYDYCVSSSNNDCLQDYQGQRALLLDDLRDSVFKLNDLLKILDNHTGSSVKSRFANKVFTGDLIIITSVIPLFEWYKGVDTTVSMESRYQLYRRINAYFEVTKDTIYSYSALNTNGYPDNDTVKVIPNVVTAMFSDIDTRNKGEEFISSVDKLLRQDDRFKKYYSENDLLLKKGLKPVNLSKEDKIDFMLFN